VSTPRLVDDLLPPMLTFCTQCNALWSARIEVDRDNLQKPWRFVHSLLDRSRSAASSLINMESFNQFYAENVAKIRANTNGTLFQIFIRVRFVVSFLIFKILSPTDVVNAINRLLYKYSATDPITTYVFKQIAYMVAPFIAAIFSRSLAFGCFPADFKHAYFKVTGTRSGRFGLLPTSLYIGAAKIVRVSGRPSASGLSDNG
jgi:hypothetical protein